MLSFGFSISLMGKVKLRREFLDARKDSGKHCIKKDLFVLV